MDSNNNGIEFPDNIASVPGLNPSKTKLILRNYQRTRKQIMQECDVEN
jgi:hypothetical protein